MKTPTELNGHAVIASASYPNDPTRQIVICHRPAHEQAYVVATWRAELGDTWATGHYFKSIIFAAGYFAERTGQPQWEEAA